MNQRVWKADALLLLTAFIWGFSFVAQRVGMEHIGPFLFGGIRFALGGMVVLAHILLTGRHKRQSIPYKRGAILGGILFLAVSFQQLGLVYTTAGKAGFITGMYVVFVPLIGSAFKHRTPLMTWLGALVALMGLYLLSVTEDLHIHPGDMLVAVCAVMWAFHILYIDHCNDKEDPVMLAVVSFFACAGFSLVVALSFETIPVGGILDAAVPILYGGALSVGVAFTIQVIAQKDAPPAHAAILFSLESAFALLGGVIILGESLDVRGYAGCGLLFAGMLLSQANRFRRKHPAAL